MGTLSSLPGYSPRQRIIGGQHSYGFELSRPRSCDFQTCSIPFIRSGLRRSSRMYRPRLTPLVARRTPTTLACRVFTSLCLRTWWREAEHRMTSDYNGVHEDHDRWTSGTLTPCSIGSLRMGLAVWECGPGIGNRVRYLPYG
jgi:hypothetical protein